MKWLTAQRVLHARQLLGTGELPVDQVASASGLGSLANFRRHFTAAVGVSPAPTGALSGSPPGNQKTLY